MTIHLWIVCGTFHILLEELGSCNVSLLALKAENIPLIALKNAGIARAIYPYLEECPMGDFDVLVKKSDFVRAHEIVMQQGFDLGFRAENTAPKHFV